MEESRGETFIGQEHMENFIKDFRFIPENDKLVEATKQIETFIQLTVHHSSTQNQSQSKASCNNVRFNRIPQSTRLQLENEHTHGKIFQWKYDHLEMVKTSQNYIQIHIDRQRIYPPYDSSRLPSIIFSVQGAKSTNQ